MRGSRAWRVAAVAWAAAIVVFGVLPTQGVVHAVSGGRDDLSTAAGHFAAYALLAFVLAVSLGVAIELVQAPLPYRDCQLTDALVNAAGAALGLAVFSAAARVRARRPRGRRG